MCVISYYAVRHFSAETKDCHIRSSFTLARGSTPKHRGNTFVCFQGSCQTIMSSLEVLTLPFRRTSTTYYQSNHSLHFRLLSPSPFNASCTHPVWASQGPRKHRAIEALRVCGAWVAECCAISADPELNVRLMVLSTGGPQPMNTSSALTRYLKQQMHSKSLCFTLVLRSPWETQALSSAHCLNPSQVH